MWGENDNECRSLECSKTNAEIYLSAAGDAFKDIIFTFENISQVSLKNISCPYPTKIWENETFDILSYISGNFEGTRRSYDGKFELNGWDVFRDYSVGVTGTFLKCFYVNN